MWKGKVLISLFIFLMKTTEVAPIVKGKCFAASQPDPAQEAALNTQEKRDRDTDSELQMTENDLANIAKNRLDEIYSGRYFVRFFLAFG